MAIRVVVLGSLIASATHLVSHSTVTIPQLTAQGVHGVGKPIFQKHGLIQVGMPVRQAAVPSSIAMATPYAVAAPQKGKVVDQTEPTYFCKKEGYVLDGRDQCVKTDMAEARFVCPGGFDFYDGECLRRTSMQSICPEGYESREGTCAKVVTAASIPTCPEGSYEISPGVCERQNVETLAQHCDEGAFDGANCIVHSYADARAFCPEGFSFFDGACIQEETYDCTHHHNIPVVPTIGTLHAHQLGQQVHGHGLNNPRQLTALPAHQHLQPALQHHTLAVPTVPHNPLVASVSPCRAAAKLGTVGSLGIQNRAPCAEEAAVASVPQQSVIQATKTVVSMQKTCTRVTSTALVFACDDGILQGQRCLVRSPIPPRMICKHHGDHTNCHSKQRVAPLSICPANYTRECSNGRCECAALEAAAFVSSCPTGFQEGGDGCVRTASASIVCPTGFTLEGETCVRVLREPADCVFSVTYECDRTHGASC